jgi:hypothetical protein
MVGSSKILTVSYGTFSCTLEGFDDSFDTMKAIAEYFRDLAADDRYFGAEPPTPDAEMLARIAEREIARRVEAHEHQGRIVLRAQDGVTPMSALAGAAALAPSEPRPEADAPAAETSRAEMPAPEAAPDAITPSGSVTEDGAQVVTETPVPEADPEPEAIAEIAADAGDEEEDAPAAEWLADDEPPAAPQDLAAKLNLIRSVVGADEQYSEDEHAQDFVEPDPVDTSLWPDAAAPVSEVTDATDDRVDDEPKTMDGPIWTETSDTAMTDAPEPEAHDPRDEAALTETAPEASREAVRWESFEDEDENDTAGLTAFDDAAFTAEDLSAVDAPETMEEPDAADDTAFEDTLAALMADAGVPLTDAPEAELAEDDAETSAPDTVRPARVLKVKRSDFEAARAEGLFEEAGEDEAGFEDGSAGNIFDEDDSPLSAEEEADLQRELAELDAELGEEIDEADQHDTMKEPERVEDKSERVRFQDVAKENDLARIFDEADTQMAAPETSRRRNTIQHLRAALAATRAEKDAGADLTRKPDANPYRGDLAAAVRPRRPEALAAPARSSARPEEPRAAPLKLVAEQRVDTQRAPVQPRRITAPKPEVLEAVEGGFCDFAEELGATTLPDLLEAAAAYLADVEGRTQFSRPMLMGKLKEVDEEGFSREEGLRSFGKLLREGKLQKLSGGRFAVTEETEFRAEARRRAG